MLLNIVEKNSEVCYAVRNYEQFKIEFIHTFLPLTEEKSCQNLAKIQVSYKQYMYVSKICSTNIAAFIKVS